jgi:RHS repeat-associated protein
MSLSLPARKSLFQILALLTVSAALAPAIRAQSTGGGIGNTTSTPVPGVPHDYITGLNEIVNPANGALSVRIAQPVPHERGQNWPAYSFLYDTNSQFRLQPVWETLGSSPPFTALIKLNLAFNGNLVGTPPPGRVGATLQQQSACVQNSQYDCTTWACNVYSGYIFTDPNGGQHGLGLQLAVPVTNNSSNDCSYFGSNSYYYGGDEQYKATMDHSGNVTVVDLHGNRPMSEDVNGNYLNTTGRTAALPASPTLQTENVNSSFSLNVINNSQDGAACSQGSSIGGGPTSIEAVKSVTLPNNEQYSFQYDSTLGLLNKITYPTGATVTYTWNVIPDAEGVQYSNPIPSTLGGVCSLQHDWFAITKRVVSYDGVNNAEEQDFAYTTTWPNAQSYKWTSKTTTVTTKDLIRGTSFNTVYTYSPALPPAESDKPFEDLGYVPLENTIQYYDTNGSLLKTTTKSWGTISLLAGECETLPNGLIAGKFYNYQPYSGFSGLTQQPFNLQNALMTDLPIDVTEYDYGQVSSACTPPGSSVLPIRETVTAYQSFANTPLFPYYALQDRPSSVKVYGAVAGNKTLLEETDYAYDGVTPQGLTQTPYGHDETNFGSTSTAPRGNLTTVTRKCFVGSQNCANSVTNYAYDTTGQALSVQDANLNTTTYNYTDNYTTDDGSPPSGYTTNAFVTKITRPATNGVSHITTFQYGFNDGKLRLTTDENNQQTKYCYWTGGCSNSSFDPFVRLTQISYPDGGKSNFTYNDSPYNSSTPSPSMTTTKAMTASTNLTSLVAYDGLGHTVRSVLTSDPDCSTGDRTDTVYDGLGRVYTASNPYCTTTDSTYGLTTYLYDALGRTTQVTHPDGATILTTYTNRATEVQDEGNGTQRVTRISQSDALGHMLSLCEVASGPFVVPAGDSTSSLIGSGGAPVACGQDISANGFLTTYQYDALGNLLQVNQSGINARTFAYDSLSRLLTASNPESGTISYAYDPNGNLLTKTAPAPNQTGSATVTTTFQYDQLNRLTQKSYSDGTTPTASYAYDVPNSNFGCGGSPTYVIGRLTGASNGWPYCYQYDQMGRLSWKDIRMNPGNELGYFSYSYDLMGNLTTDTAGYGYRDVSYGYNTAGRLISVINNDPSTDNPANSFSITGTGSDTHYNAFGGLIANTLGDGEAESYSYDNRLRLKSYTATINSPNYYNTPITLYSFTINSFAPDSDVLSANDSVNGNWTYSYDPFNRLVGANLNNGASVYSYVYDRFGNRWQQNGPTNTFIATYTGNNQNNPQNNNRIDGYTHDAAGNIMSDGLHGYTYDAENRMIKVDGGSTATYVYDVDGHRVQKITTTGNYSDPAGTWYFSYDQSGRFVLESNSNFTFVRGHIYAGGRHLASVGGWMTFNHSDWVGTERFRTYMNNIPYQTESCTSLPFGDGLNCVGSDVDPLHFTGKERDAATGLDNFGARYNSSSFGRFMSPDPDNASASNEDPQAWNPYAYVRNDPVNLTDPSGMVFCRPANADEKGQGISLVCDVSDADYVNSGRNQQAAYDKAGYKHYDCSCDSGADKDAWQNRNGNVSNDWIGDGLVFGAVLAGVEGFFYRNPSRGGPSQNAPVMAKLTPREASMMKELREAGYEVEQLPQVPGQSNADFLVNGVKTELKTLEGEGPTTLKNAIQRGAKQGDQILIDARGTNLTPAQAANQIARAQGNVGGLSGRVTVLTKEGVVKF